MKRAENPEPGGGGGGGGEVSPPTEKEQPFLRKELISLRCLTTLARSKEVSSLEPFQAPGVSKHRERDLPKKPAARGVTCPDSMSKPRTRPIRKSRMHTTFRAPIRHPRSLPPGH